MRKFLVTYMLSYLVLWFCLWIKSYLTEKECSVSYKVCSSQEHWGSSGTPQGLNIGPFLLLLCFNDFWN